MYNTLTKDTTIKLTTMQVIILKRATSIALISNKNLFKNATTDEQRAACQQGIEECDSFQDFIKDMPLEDQIVVFSHRLFWVMWSVINEAVEAQEEAGFVEDARRIEKFVNYIWDQRDVDKSYKPY